MCAIDNVGHDGVIFDIHIVFSEGNYRTVHFLSFLLVGEHSYIKQLSITAERR
jgi:hypothetical protein